MKRCKNYFNPQFPVGEVCAEHSGMYQDEEIAEHFWKDGTNKDGHWSVCKHCMWNKRNVSKHEPVLTKDWPRDENGRLLNYWHLIDDDIVLNIKEE